MTRGLFLTFEGIDGSGKSTQIAALAARLRSLGYEVLETAEPGGPPVGRQIRAILLDKANSALSPTCEMLLYFAARAQNADEWIRPALDRGAVVLCDRWTDSTLAYQGGGRGLGESVVRTLDRIVCRHVSPHRTFYLDIDLETSFARMADREHDRLEGEARRFKEDVRAAYLALAQAEPERIIVIDARPDADAVAASIWNAVAPLLPERPR